jgi:predicted nucleotidyltransferase/DNA-binding Xre family transcriptional regulator
MEHATRIGSQIKALRRAKGLSAASLASRAGVTENAIRKIEAGDSKEPRFSTGVRIAAALSVEPRELIALTDVASYEPHDLAAAVRTLRREREKLNRFGIAHVSIFGSVARGDASAKSDIDVIVEPLPTHRLTLFDLAAISELLCRLLGARVDVVTASTLKRSQIAKSAQNDAVNVF